MSEVRKGGIRESGCERGRQQNFECRRKRRRRPLVLKSRRPMASIPSLLRWSMSACRRRAPLQLLFFPLLITLRSFVDAIRRSLD